MKVSTLPLRQILIDRIAKDGPIGVDAYMAACLGDPQHGYYRTRDPLGVAGDFTTAPEISQIFGEIIGAWCADLWDRLGRPKPFNLIELGPGRGTLMADMLRVFRRLPGAMETAEIHLIETSPALSALQAATLQDRHPDVRVSWHANLAETPPGPFILIANEFFDALPIRQWIKRGAAWCERLIGLNSQGNFAFAEGLPTTPPYPAPIFAEEGDIFETNEPADDIGRQIGDRLSRDAAAALIIDYGHLRAGVGDTVQALQRHRPVSIFDAPGEADLTAHVDFRMLKLALVRLGAAVSIGTTQAEFLLGLGAAQRADRLKRGKSEAEADAIAQALRRLVHPAEMGTLFKVLAAASPGAGPFPGFPQGSI